jgi:hypothetical protein
MIHAKPGDNIQATTPASYVLDLFFRQKGGYASGGAKYCAPIYDGSYTKGHLRVLSIFCEMIKPVTLAAIFEAVVIGRMQTAMCHSTTTCNPTCL